MSFKGIKNLTSADKASSSQDDKFIIQRDKSSLSKYDVLDEEPEGDQAGDAAAPRPRAAS